MPTPRFNLPNIEFVTKDVEDIEMSIINRVEELMNTTLTNADPRRKFIQAIAYGLFLTRNSMDYAAKQLLLSYAEDDFLDHKGEDEKTPRLEPKKAQTTLRFELTMAAGETGVIPKGTRVTGNNEVFFETMIAVPISSELTHIDIQCECLEEGINGNNFLPNQLNQLVDPLPWISRVYNLTKSQGGVDWEENDPYAERIRLSKEAYSTAGPEDAYIYHAKRASQLIGDVSVRFIETEETVEIAPLLLNGDLPTADILNAVLETCNERKVRPLTDKVIVTAPEVLSYDVDVTYYIPVERESVSASIQQEVQKAIDDYNKWQKSKLGRGIDPSELNFKMRQAGAKRIEIRSPYFVDLDKHQVARVNNINIVFGGVTND